MTLIHRDPRDIILSTIDHGMRKTSDESNRFFAQFQSIEQTLPRVVNQCKIALDWINTDLTEIFQYQSLITNPQDVISRFCNKINQKSDRIDIEKIIMTYTTQQKPGVRQYNTGKLTRYKEEMTNEEIELCNNALSKYILDLGYKL